MFISQMDVSGSTGAGKDRGNQFGQKDKKPTTPSSLSSAARLEHALVLQSLQECIGPRLSPEVPDATYASVVRFHIYLLLKML